MVRDQHDGQDRLALASGVSTLPDPVDAGAQAAGMIQDGLDGSADLVIGFVTPAYSQRVGMIADAIRNQLSPKHLLLLSASSIMGGDAEIGPGPGLSLMGFRLPGVSMHPYMLDATWGTMDPTERASKITQTIGATETMACSLFFADPYSVPMVNLVPALSASRVEYTDANKNHKRIGTILGGLCSGADEPGYNTLYLDGTLRSHGAMGITLSGNLQVDTIVSQGCRPIGEPRVVTKARGNLILELGGQPAIDVIRDMLIDLGHHDKEMLVDGLLIGRVINEHKSRFGRGDFLIRDILGGDEESGALAIADLVHTGQTIQPHLHDAQTAREDLALLLDAQRLYDRPAGGLLISCAGRTQEFFQEPNHDGRAIRHAFDPPIEGPRLAKAGKELNAPDMGFPLSGFFAEGQIGPVGETIFQHSHTAVAALFREPEQIDLD